MQKRKSRTEINIEMNRRLVIHQRKGATANWCPACAAIVDMVTPDEAAIITRISTRKIYSLVEAGWVHFLETNEGLLFLCLPSLLERP